MSVAANSLNELTFKTCKYIINEGLDIPSRNGASKEVCDTSLFLNSPKNRHLYLEGRTNNIFGTIGEVFWILAGKNEISPVLELFVPRAANYSDDGKTWRAAYGDRLFEGDQIHNVVKMFCKDGKNTRRAVMALWQPQKDTLEAVNKQGFEDSKDYPCSNFLWFWIRDNKLNCKLGMRSNDWIFGGSNINVFEFTILQEIILQLLKQADPVQFNEVELGYYHHSVISLHLYDSTIKQAYDILSNEAVNYKREIALENFPISLGFLDYPAAVNFFKDIYEVLSGIVTDTKDIDDMEMLFLAAGAGTYGNQLFGYAILAAAYLSEKKGITISFPAVKKYLSPDLLFAVQLNHFIPKGWLAGS